ncbi:tetratricopeptide repeat protein, partial [Lysobacter sp. D1-1-M9]
MDAEHWSRLSPLLDALFELEPRARERRLNELRAEDKALAADLEALMALEQERDDFLAKPIMMPAADGMRAGTEVGPYRLESLLGEGGMGQVWLASRADGLYQRRVALKLLRPGLANTDLRLRFTRERQILARLAHPNIARLLDAGISADGLPYLALEYVDGQPITDYCSNQRTPLETRLQMFRQVCDAVSHAHANLIVHRDLKPSNILVTPGGEVRLLDFGIAKLLDTEVPAPEQTRTGMRAFTLHYAAPEQVRGEPVSTMTDVYSLGVVLYELLTESKPYRLKRNSDAEWEEAILSADPLRPSQAVLRTTDGATPTPARRRHARTLAGDLDNIVLKTLSKRAEQRYPSVEALSLDLQRYVDGKPVQARPQSIGYRMRKYLRRQRWAVASGSLVAVVLVGALASVAWQAREAVQEASRAQAMQDFMVGLFDHASGARANEPLDLRQLLDDAVERGNRQLARQPRDRAELLGVVARVRTGLGDYREALGLLDRQSEIITLLGDDLPPSLRLESLAQRGRVLRMLGRSDECIALLQPMLPLSRREQAQLPPQATELYSQLGRCHRVNGDRQSARQLFERSLALRRETGGDSVGEVQNLMDLAGLHADVDEVETALRGFDRARAQLRRDVGDRHPLLIEIRRNLGNLYRAVGNIGAAESELRGALAIALELNGTGHPATLAVRRQLAAVQVDQGQYDEADAGFREIHQQLVERLGAGHRDLAGSYLRLGLLAWERGDLPGAIDLLQQALAITREDADPVNVAEALSNLAQVLHAAGRSGEARPLLQEARSLRSEHYGARHALVGDIDRLLGEVEIALGEPAAGEARLRQALQLTRAGYGRDHPLTRLSEVVLAYHTGLSGDATMDARLDALSQLPAEDREARAVARRARAYAAHLRCDGGQHEQ